MNQVKKNDFQQTVKLFEYTLICFLDWFVNSVEHPNKCNDISVLKSMKLLFFLTAETYSNGHSKIIDEHFNNFHAMPYGPVESDIYNYLKDKNGVLSFITVDTNGIRINPSDSLSEKPFLNLIVELKNTMKELVDNNELTAIINQAIESMRQRNNNLVIYTPFDLVDLSHRWYSWKKNISIAYYNNQNSFAIPITDIKQESKGLIF